MSKIAKTPGRKAAPAAQKQGPEFVGKTPEDVAAGQELMHQVQTGYGADRDLINQLVGRTQAASAFARFSLTVVTSQLAQVKESKAYKSMAGVVTPDGRELTGTWEDFCSLVGISVAKADEDIANLRAFGEEALEAMSRSGIGYRELRQFRSLPDDSKSALIEIARTGDKDAVLDIAEELITRQAKEKDKLADRLAHKTAEYEALSHNLAKTNEVLDQVKAKAALIPRMKPDKKANEMLAELERDFLDARAGLQQTIKGVETLLAHTSEHGLDYNEQIESLAMSLTNQALSLLATLRLADINGPADHALTALDAG